ncbi:TPA: NAD-dependent epimerase/dehydratase family protein [Candidatus Micrarchaeota archaeon]|nr:NAD-dependent epimerase/dehydratase family protein [Candidatus Micrarchaeota archaeon]
MKILLTGASGFIGGHVRKALEQDSHEVICADRHHGMNFNQMNSAEDWLPMLKGVDAAINAVGIIVERGENRFHTLHQEAPAALFNACDQAGVSRVVQISALGADDQSFTPYQLTKKSADDTLRSLPVDWFVLRPSLVIGEGGASLAMFRRMARLPLLVLADGGSQRVQPVHVADLVDTVRHCLVSDRSRLTLDVVGPEPMSFAQWLNRLRKHEGRSPARILPVPFSLILAMAHAGRFLVPIMHPDNLRMLQRGNTSDPGPLEDFLGRQLRPVEQAL